MENLPSGCITLEEHATFPSLGDEHPAFDNIWKQFPSVRTKLRNHDQGRLADMDAGHVDIQILSHLNGISNLKTPHACRAANDEMAEAIRRNPTRFKGFAALCMMDPDSAARELERAVTKLGLLGTMIDNHLPDMTHFDDGHFWPVFAMADKLDVPIYLHPAPASDQVMNDRFRGSYPEEFATALSTGSWGWHENEGLHIVKLYCAGLFKRFPKLKIIIGHMGEMVPMMIDRIDRATFFHERGGGTFREIWERNIWVTTSGFFTVRTLEMLLKVTPLEHVMYSVDTPFSNSTEGWKFVEGIASSGVLTKQELEMFVAGNARKLFKL